MRQAVVLVLLSSVCVYGAEPKSAEAIQELTKLQGTWKVVAVEVNGKRTPDNYFSAITFNMIFRGDQLTIHVKGRKSEKRELLTVKLNPARKTMDLISLTGQAKGKKTLAIYSLQGDTLKICQGMSSQTVVVRPASFTTKPKDGYGVYILKKVNQ